MSTTPPSAPEPASPTPEKQQLSSTFDLLTHSTAPALLFMYAVGFVILGFHDAKFGVVQFSPFRARIVLVGFVFSLLVSLAAAAYHYGFAYFSPLKPVVNDSEPKRRFHREIVLGVGFLYTAGFISALLGNFIFFQSPVQHDRTNWIQSVEGIGLYMLAFVLLMIASGNFRKRPEVAILLSLLGLAFAILALFGRPGFSRPFNYLILMLAIVGWHTGIIKHEKSPLRFALDFRNWFFVLILLWIYISQIFTAMPPRWGGGQPTPVQIFQNTPVSWSQSNPMDVLLLDETDQGFYVLLSPNGKAFFVPRSNVSSILFGSKEDLPKKP